MSVSTQVLAVLSEEDWQHRRDVHHARVDDWLAGHRYRRSRAQKHPVEDFLFEYYSYRPYLLRRWHPGHGTVLAGKSAAEFLELGDYHRVAEGITLDTGTVLGSRGDTVRWVQNLLRRTLDRPAQFGCFGMHEWAMAYRRAQPQVRHPDWPLRLPPERLAAIVEERGVRCSHFDAFRFFTAEAKPLNIIQPTRASQPDLEQSGCLHANMDLYKWAYKLSPLVRSELVGDCFLLAREIRELDMRASPYDLTALGYEPVAIETPGGRVDYAAHQRTFAARANVLRHRLLEVLEPLAAGPADAAIPGTSRADARRIADSVESFVNRHRPS